MQFTKKTRKELKLILEDIMDVNFPEELLVLLCVQSANLILDEAEKLLEEIPEIEDDGE